MIRIPRRFSSFAPPLIKRKVRSGGVTGHVSDGAFTMAAINSRRNRRALHAESRDADSAFVAKETFTTRGKSTIRSISREEERYAIKSRPPLRRENCGRFSLRERERGREIDQGQRSGRRDLARLLKRVTWMI